MRPLPSVIVLAALFLSFAAHAQAPVAPPPGAGPSEAEIARAIQGDQTANRSAAVASPGTVTSEAPTVAGLVPRAIQSLNPDISFITDFAGAWFSHSRMVADMQGDHDPHENGFNLQALEMAIGATVDPYFRFDSNIVFKQAGLEIEEAYGTTLTLPGGFQIRAGKFFTRFGRFNPTHPHSWNFADQPLVLSQFFGGDGNRGLGLEVSELVGFLPWYVEVLLSATDARGGTTNRSFLSASAVDQAHSPSDFQYTFAIKQFFPLSDDVSLSWGLSGATAPNAAGRRSEVLGTDVYLKWRPLGEPQPPIVSLQGEFLLRRYETAGGVLTDTGAFAQLLYRFAPRWAAGVGGEYVTTPSSDVGGVLSACNATPVSGQPSAACAAGTTQRYKSELTFYPTEFSRLRLQYNFEPPGPTHNVSAHAVFLAVEFGIGAHGAHQF